MRASNERRPARTLTRLGGSGTLVTSQVLPANGPCTAAGRMAGCAVPPSRRRRRRHRPPPSPRRPSPVRLTPTVYRRRLTSGSGRDRPPGQAGLLPSPPARVPLLCGPTGGRGRRAATGSSWFWWTRTAHMSPPRSRSASFASRCRCGDQGA